MTLVLAAQAASEILYSLPFPLQQTFPKLKSQASSPLCLGEASEIAWQRAAIQLLPSSKCH